MEENTLTAVDRLRESALDQHGYITTAQASELNVSKAALSILAKRGRIERVGHGIYHIPQVPFSQYAPLMLAVLWTGVPEAALSHETALDLYEVSDINPFKIFVTVGKDRRIRRKGPEKYKLHYQDLQPNQITWREQIPTVTLPTAIKQCIDIGVPSYLVRQAIENGRNQGLVLSGEKDNLLNRLEERNRQ